MLVSISIIFNFPKVEGKNMADILESFARVNVL